MRCLRYLVHGVIEGKFVGLRGLREATQFADKLQRRRVDFLVRCRRFEVVKGLNISTHKFIRHLMLELSLASCRSTRYIEAGDLRSRPQGQSIRRH